MSDSKAVRKQKVMNINDILQQSSLSSLLEKHQYYQQIYATIEQLIPQQFSGKIRLAEITDERFLFHVANGIVYQSLLFQQHQILQLIQQKYPQIKHLEFKVIPSLG